MRHVHARSVFHRWLLVVLLAGCGGKAVIDVDEVDDEQDAAPTTTTTTTTTGPGGGGTGGQGGGLAEGCPPTLPMSGACTPDGLLCDYGGFCNFVMCESGSWTFPLC